MPPSHLMDNLLPMLLHPRTQFILCVAQAVPWKRDVLPIGGLDVVRVHERFGEKSYFDVKLESTAICSLALITTSPANRCQSV